jgi:nucleoside-triphosphatase THEP1
MVSAALRDEVDQRMGDYRVDVAAVDQLFTAPLRGALSSDGLLIVDEIGRMQMLSP